MNLITLLIKSLNVEGEKLYLEHSVFFSEIFNHDYEYLEVYEIKIIKKLKKKIVNFVISYCDKNKSIKIKEIINPVKKKKLKYKNEVIVSCVFK